MSDILVYFMLVIKITFVFIGNYEFFISIHEIYWDVPSRIGELSHGSGEDSLQEKQGSLGCIVLGTVYNARA